LYYGEFEGPFNYKLFKPASSGIPNPEPDDPMTCIACGNPWYMLNVKGGLLVMTDRGWKPREPSGSPKIIKPGDQNLVVYSGDSKTEFVEPR
jgi:hypothetical protein